MNKQYTAKNLEATGKLFEAIASAAPDKAIIASVAAESFVNGMNAMEQMCNRKPPISVAEG